MILPSSASSPSPQRRVATARPLCLLALAAVMFSVNFAQAQSSTTPDAPQPSGNTAQGSFGPGAAVAPLPPGAAGLPKAVAAPGALTLQQVIALAQTRNPTLLSARQNLDSVRAQEVQAGVRANPNFGLVGSNISLPAEGASNPYQYSAQVSRLFERGDKRRYRLDVARSTTEQTAAQLGDQQRNLVFSLKQAFTNMLVAKTALALAQDNLKDFRHEVDINRDRLDAGDIDQLDFKRLDLQLAQFETDEATAKTNLAQASFQLQTLTGATDPTDDPARFDILGDVVPPALSADMAELEQRALLSRPDYIAAQAGVRVADANLHLAIANGTTDPTLEGEYDRSGTYNSAGFSVNVPLRLFDRNQGNKETARFQVSASQLASTAAANQVRSDVAQAFAGYTNAKTLADRYDRHYIEESRQVLDIAQFAYEHGGLGLIDYLDALREARTTAGNALNAYSQTWLALHQLSFATGTELLP